MMSASRHNDERTHTRERCSTSIQTCTWLPYDLMACRRHSESSSRPYPLKCSSHHTHKQANNPSLRSSPETTIPHRNITRRQAMRECKNQTSPTLKTPIRIPGARCCRLCVYTTQTFQRTTACILYLCAIIIYIIALRVSCGGVLFIPSLMRVQNMCVCAWHRKSSARVSFVFVYIVLLAHLCDFRGDGGNDDNDTTTTARRREAYDSQSLATFRIAPSTRSQRNEVQRFTAGNPGVHRQE